MAMQVHHGNNQHLAVFHRVNDAVRKTMCAAAADFLVKRLPCLRPLDDAMNRLTNFPEKIMTKARNTVFVIARRVPQFLPGRRQQAEFHHFNSASMDLMAASPSRA